MSKIENPKKLLEKIPYWKLSPIFSLTFLDHSWGRM